MMKRILKRVSSLVLSGCIAFSIVGCTGVKMKNVTDLTAEYPPPAQKNVPPLTDEQARLLTDFGLRLAWHSMSGSENGLVSPMSVATTLGITANGARGETLTEMEGALGMEQGSLNQALYAYWRDMPKSSNAQLLPANSVWLTDDERFTVVPEFLQTASDYYHAQVFKAPMDMDTCKAINGWVGEHTDGMIPQILDQIPEEAVMYLVNALAFEGEWPVPYEERQVREGVFLTHSGYPVDAEFMYSDEYLYLENEWVTGVMKHYKGGRYAFVGLLPREDRSLMATLDGLTGESLHELLKHPQEKPVDTMIPKFETEYKVELRGALADMGMERAFDLDLADFSGLGRYEDKNVLIDRVLHKTFLSMGEQGTRAGAATVVEMPADSEAPEPEERREVFLDRPFLYLLIDTESCVPFFIGAMGDPTGEAPESLAGGPGLTVQIDGKRYGSTGKLSYEPTCGTADGEITSTVPFGEVPGKDNQSNFGTGWGYQYAGDEIILMLGSHRVIFEQI